MTQFFVERPVALLMSCIALIVLGVAAGGRIPLRLLPENPPTEFLVSSSFRGASAEEVERSLSTPLERLLSTVPGLLHIESRSTRELSSIRMRFRAGEKALELASSIKDKLEGFGPPEGAGRPRIEALDEARQPLLRVGVSLAEGSSAATVAGELQAGLIRSLEGLEGMAAVELLGAPKSELRIELDPVRARAYEIQAGSLPAALEAVNKEHHLGLVELSGKLVTLRAGSRLESLAAVKGTVLKAEKGRVVRLEDIAEVGLVEREPEVRPRLFGKRALLLELRREAEANAVQLAARARSLLAEHGAERKDSLRFEILFDEGSQIAGALSGVSDAVLWGGLLSALVLFLLLQSAWGSLVVCAITPLSLLLTMMLMHYLGLSFNVMSLAGLALGVGMLMDNATVVLESIEEERLRVGDPKEAAILGTGKVTGSVIGSTLTQIVVFGPLIFVEGPIGRLFRDLAISISLSLLSSLLLALTVIPTLSALGKKRGRAGNPAAPPGRESGPPQTPFRWDMSHLGARYGVALAALAAEASALAATAGRRSAPARQLAGLWLQELLRRISGFVLACERATQQAIPPAIRDPRPLLRWVGLSTAFAIAVFWLKGSELFPDENLESVSYSLEFEARQPLRETERLVAGIELELMRIPGVRYSSASVGEEGENRARLLLRLDGGGGAGAIRGIAAVLKRVPDLRFRRLEPGKGKPVELELYHESLERLRELTERSARALASVPGVVDVESDFLSVSPELKIRFSPLRLGAYGLSAQAFLGELRPLLGEQGAGSFTLGGRYLPSRIASRPGFLDSREKIGAFSLPASGERRPVFLSQVAELEELDSFAVIQHSARKRMAVVQANLDGTDLGTANRRIERKLGPLLREGGVSWKLGGQAEERRRSSLGLALAFLVSLFAIYLILASQFENLRQPLVVLAAVPLCVSGVAACLLLFGLSISIMVYVAFVLLIGVSINTSILMVDCANQLLLEGKSPGEAIVESTVKRIKPILVTTACNLVGLVPLVLSLDPGTAMQRPLAVSLLGGQFSSLVFTLLLVPALYVRAVGKRHG